MVRVVFGGETLVEGRFETVQDALDAARIVASDIPESVDAVVNGVAQALDAQVSEGVIEIRTKSHTKG